MVGRQDKRGLVDNHDQIVNVYSQDQIVKVDSRSFKKISLTDRMKKRLAAILLQLYIVLNTPATIEANVGSGE